MGALLHYLKWGWQENHRRPAPWFDPSAYRRHFCLSEETDPLLDYVLRGEPSVFADLTGSTQSVAQPGSVDFKPPVEPTLLRSAQVPEAGHARPLRIPDDFDSRSSPDPIDPYPYTIAPLVNSTDQNLRGLVSACSDSTSSSRMGYVDHCKAGVIVGWAYDIFMPKGVTVNIFIDNLHVDSQLCNELRGDVMLAGHKAGSVGFSYAIPDIFFDGEPHTICVKFLDGEPLPFVANGSSNFTLLLKSKIQFDGWIDRVEGDVIFGWLARRTQSGRLHAGGKVAIYCNEELVGQVKADDYRPDVAAALNVDAACGFHFQIPPRFLNKTTEISVETFPQRWTLNGSPISLSFLPAGSAIKLSHFQNDLDEMSVKIWQMKQELKTLSLNKPSTDLSSYDAWAKRSQSRSASQAGGAISASMRPLVSVLCPVFRPRLKDFIAAVNSVRAQTYDNWELVIVDDKSDSSEVTAVINEFVASDSRIRCVEHNINCGISEATNTAFIESRGSFIAFFDHDDMLVDMALELMIAPLVATGSYIAYSDEDKLDDQGVFSEPNFKPDWNLRLLMAQNYVCHFLIVKREIIDRVGLFRSEYNGAQDHDFVLRLSEIVPADRILHISEILYHWRKTPNSTAVTVSNKHYAIDAGVNAVQHFLDRRGAAGNVRSRGAMTNYIIDWKLREDRPSVSIIIPFKDRIDMNS